MTVLAHSFKLLFILTLTGLTALFFKDVGKAVAGVQHLDKLAHFSAFVLLSLISAKAFNIPVWLNILLLSCYGGLIEIVQGQLPYRSASWLDFLADLAGIICFFICYQLLLNKKKRRLDQAELNRLLNDN